jgi:hypothetical protein
MPTLYYERGQASCPRRVYVAIPCGEGRPFDGNMVALTNLALALQAAGWAMDFAMESGNCHVDDARNSLFRHFRHHAKDCERFLFIDCDVIYSVHDAVKLVTSPRDIVAGIYPKKQDDLEFPVNLSDDPERVLQAEADGCLEVPRVPTGFLCLSRKVIETLVDASPQFEGQSHMPGDSLYPLLCERKLEDQPRPGHEAVRRWSGDYALCNKATAAGFKIYIYPEMRLGHIGTKVWWGKLGDQLRERHHIPHPDLMRCIDKLRADEPNATVFEALYDRWGNPFAATPPMLIAAYSKVRRMHPGDLVLETGSGLTSLVMGLAAEKSGATIYALEHDVDWLLKSERLLFNWAGLDRSVALTYAPLHFYEGDKGGRYCWYETTSLPKRNFEFVVCDGPQRRFGRAGLYKQLGPRIKDAPWIMDDAGDPRELAVFTEAATKLGRTVEVFGEAWERQFALAVPVGPQHISAGEVQAAE